MGPHDTVESVERHTEYEESTTHRRLQHQSSLTVCSANTGSATYPHCVPYSDSEGNLNMKDKI